MPDEDLPPWLVLQLMQDLPRPVRLLMLMDVGVSLVSRDEDIVLRCSDRETLEKAARYLFEGYRWWGQSVGTDISNRSDVLDRAEGEVDGRWVVVTNE